MGCASQVDATIDIRSKMAQHAQALSTSELLRIIRSFNQAVTESRSTWQPALPLEMGFVEGLQKPPASAGLDNDDKSQVTPKQARVEPEYRPDAPVTSQAKPVGDPAAPSAVATAKPEQPVIGESEASPQDQQATQTLSDAWPKILDLVRRQNSKANGLLNSCKGRYMRGNAVYLIFASDILKENMEKRENLDAVEFVLAKVFQRQIGVKCQVDTARRDSIPAGVDDDGMVAAALRDLGGEIVDIQ